MMARRAFRPVSVTTDRACIIFRDARGDELPIDMPNDEGARFCALAIAAELKAARRTTPTT